MIISSHPTQKENHLEQTLLILYWVVFFPLQKKKKKGKQNRNYTNSVVFFLNDLLSAFVVGWVVFFSPPPPVQAAGTDDPEEHPGHQEPARDPQRSGEHIISHAGTVKAQVFPQPPTGGMQSGSLAGICTHRIHVFARFGANL